MRNKKLVIYAVSLVVVFLSAGASQTFAQPSDAQLKKQLTSPLTVSVTLGKPGKIEGSSTYKKWVWTRNFTAKLKTDEPGIFLIVKGYAAYDVMGGSYVYSRTFTTSNSYEGIPNPTAADVQALFKTFGAEKFVGRYIYKGIVGDVESIGLGPEPEYEWHTPNSVSLTVVAVYTQKGRGGRGPIERGEQTFRVRLYRKTTKDPWHGVHSTRKDWKKL